MRDRACGEGGGRGRGCLRVPHPPLLLPLLLLLLLPLLLLRSRSGALELNVPLGGDVPDIADRLRARGAKPSMPRGFCSDDSAWIRPGCNPRIHPYRGFWRSGVAAF